MAQYFTFFATLSVILLCNISLLLIFGKNKLPSLAKCEKATGTSDTTQLVIQQRNQISKLLNNKMKEFALKECESAQGGVRETHTGNTLILVIV